MRTIFGMMMLLFPLLSFAQVVSVDGRQITTMQVQITQTILPDPATNRLSVSFAIPQNYRSPTYSQEIQNFEIKVNPPQNRVESRTDDLGNRFRIYYWENPGGEIQTTVSVHAQNNVLLDSIQLKEIPFPPPTRDGAVQFYLKPSAAVQSDDPQIIQLARQLSLGMDREYQVIEAVQRWVVSNLHYILQPDRFDAVSTLESRQGNCQNYSHLSAALLRSLGIPVRIVNGITLDWPYQIEIEQDVFQFEMARGRHSWIEVYFPRLGWLPFDPQQSEFFVSNRYLRFEIGVDNEQAINDGLVRWSGSLQQGAPRVSETISAENIQENLALRGSVVDPSLPKMLLTPPVQAERPLLARADSTEPTLPVEETTVPRDDFTALNYTENFSYGNTNFPEHVNFAFARTSTQTGQLTRNFLVETAEYVTSKEQFAQVFILNRPVKLEYIDLALHKFGGSGAIWLELSEDRNGRPGPGAAASRRIPLQYFKDSPGYSWVRFDFRSEGLILSPGNYWIRLVYSGSPIINWFYSYGKNTGPANGTRSRSAGNPDWNRVHAFEFIYRIVGKTTQWPHK